MHVRKEAARVSAGLALIVSLCGCAGKTDLPLAAPVDAGRIVPRERAAAPVADLRIQDTTLVSADIPIVPLPASPGDRQPATPARQTKTAVPMPTSPMADVAPTMPSVLAEPPPPMTNTTPVTGIENLRRVLRGAADSYANIDSYIARLTRREQVNGKNKPEEVMEFRFRKAPWSVYFKWLSENGRGREVIYVRGQYEDKIHTLLAAGDFPLAPAGKRMALSPDSMFVRSASRHPIGEAGIGASVERLGVLLAANERGDFRRGVLTDLGRVNRPEFKDRQVNAVEQSVPPGTDESMPRGGRRYYFFDPDSHLPVLLFTRNEVGQEVEYYFYDRLQYPVRLDGRDFNPDIVWGKAPRR